MDLSILRVVWSPTRTLQEVAQSRNVLAGAVAPIAYATLSLVAAVIAVLGGITDEQFWQAAVNLPPDTLENLILATEIGTILAASFPPFLLWAIVSLLM